VQNQDPCGSCWIHATTALLANKEAMISGSPPENVSENPWIGCASGLSRGDCNAPGAPLCSFTNVGMTHVRPGMEDFTNETCASLPGFDLKNGGISTDLVVLKSATWPLQNVDHPTNADSMCQKKSELPTNKWQFWFGGGVFTADMTMKQREVMEKLYKYGAVASSIDGGSDLLQKYTSGIIKQPTSADMKINHWVVVVGYGVENSSVENGTPFWTIRNSWGQQYGEDGHFRILRDNDAELQSNSAPLMVFKALSYILDDEIATTSTTSTSNTSSTTSRPNTSSTTSSSNASSTTTSSNTSSTTSSTNTSSTTSTVTQKDTTSAASTVESSIVLV